MGGEGRGEGGEDCIVPRLLCKYMIAGVVQGWISPREKEALRLYILLVHVMAFAVIKSFTPDAFTRERYRHSTALISCSFSRSFTRSPFPPLVWRPPTCSSAEVASTAECSL